jgi:4-diphosphocytidyl-2-C-methyl-D-erythritol kinase
MQFAFLFQQNHHKNHIMMVYPPAKINIGLSITEKRLDGFHNIETVFYPIPLCDILDIEAAGISATQKLDFICTGIELPGNNPHENLCCKAYHMLDVDYDLPPAIIRLHKTIPAGAGLGGGSADAAYTLQALNDLFQLHIPDGDLARYVSRLGSDCAFFLCHNPAFGTGKGDILESIALSLAEYHLLLIKPPVFVSTAEAYSSVVPKKVSNHLPELLQAPVSDWRHTVFNDFEESVFKKFPEIGRIKEKLYREGALYASMSGSGSSVYGIFSEIPKNMEESFPGCFVWNS